MITELEKYLPRPIKEVMAEFPALVDILNEYDIGCGTCMVGTCLLKDIVSIHALPPERERDLMDRIAGVIAPSGKAKAAPVHAPPPRREHHYSPPINKLVDEHGLIKKLLALIPEIIVKMDLTSEAGRKTVADTIDFIRAYADRFHHRKEEDILFKYFDEKSEIIQAMHSDHEEGRGHVQAVGEALARGDEKTLCQRLWAYRELLLAHIKKEDEILYPWMERNLSEEDKEALARQFEAAERNMGADLPGKYEKLIDALAENTL